MGGRKVGAIRAGQLWWWGVGLVNAKPVSAREINDSRDVGATSPATPGLADYNLPMNKSYYERHIFFCTNRRDDGRACCAASSSERLQAHAKARVKELGLSGEGKVRVNKAGCLDRCELGPVAVVYPEAIWYTFVDEQDIDEIVESHLRDGRPVERLKLE